MIASVLLFALCGAMAWGALWLFAAWLIMSVSDTIMSVLYGGGHLLDRLMVAKERHGSQTGGGRWTW